MSEHFAKKEAERQVRRERFKAQIAEDAAKKAQKALAPVKPAASGHEPFEGQP